MQDKFKEAPVVLVTSEHLRTGKEYDAALIWTEDVTKDSFKVCLRELQNFDGKHEDINVVCILLFFFLVVALLGYHETQNLQLFFGIVLLIDWVPYGEIN